MKHDATSMTLWMLMARYKGAPFIPAETVCEDFFQPLSYSRFLHKVESGEINLPLVRMDDSRKTPKYLALEDLALFLDSKHEAAVREATAIAS